MVYSSSPSNLLVREDGFKYSTPSGNEYVYEISLRTVAYSDWLKDLQGAHRLVQSLLQGQLMGQYHLLDFLIWPRGIFTRVTLKNASSLSEFLKLLKEKSIPAGENSRSFWEDEPQWIKLVTPEKLSESTRSFLTRADEVRREVGQSEGFSPSLYFFYRDSRLSK